MKSFSDYYQDPEYKQNHLAYMKQKVPCKVCGEMVQRSNMTRHNRTGKKHNKMLIIDTSTLSFEQMIFLQQIQILNA